MKVLVTGGAGFIGSHLVDAYLKAGYSVRVIDNLTPQVHGALNETGMPPNYLSKEAEFIFGDICDREVMRRALEDVDILSHHAAAVGVGQSMYDIEHYTRVNSYGAAVILDLIANEKNSVKKMIVASSMSIYGEGAYIKQSTGDVIYPKIRAAKQLEAHQWEMVDNEGEELIPVPTTEEKPIAPPNIYAINKRDHEEMFLTVGRAYGIPTVALRYFNVFGSRQALSNPYTGVMAIFCGRLLNNMPPVIFEDGLQQRDFVKVDDIAKANILATEKQEADFQTVNIGSGNPVTIVGLADTIAKEMGKRIEPEIVQKYRVGDIRHCFADILKARTLLGFHPVYDTKSGASEVIEWVKQQIAEDSFDEMKSRLEKMGLVR
jgi:dTDP-L-rhamnose 4-epimerase